MMNIHNPTLRVIRILDLISQNNGLTLTKISEELKISKSTIQPILKTLLYYDYLAFNDEENTYNIGIGIFKIAQSFTGTSDSFELIKKSMREIVKGCNEICQMGIYDKTREGNVFYIAKEEPSQSISLISNIGTSLPAYATALGKSILSGFSNDKIKQIYSDGITPLTENTINTLDDLIKELEDIRKNGYAYEREESAPDIECIAVPIEQNNEIVASISVSIPTYRSSDQKIESIKKILIDQKNILEIVLKRNPLII